MQLSDLVRRVGVTPGTVSRAIHQPSLVSEKTLFAIHAAARDLGIDLSQKSRRGRPSKRSRLTTGLRLAVWFVGSGEREAHRFLGEQIGLLRAACERGKIGLDFVFSSTPEEIPRLIADRQVDCVLLQGMMPAPNVLQNIATLPSIWILTRREDHYQGDFVEPDNEANGRLAADYLAGRGHREVAFVSTEPDYPAFARRRDAFLHHCRMKRIGGHSVVTLAQDPRFHLQEPPPESALSDLAAQLLALPVRPTGIYLPGDSIIGGFYRALRRAGAEPREFDWIIGNYRSLVYSQLDPLPAAIDIDLRTIIETAVHWAVWLVKNRESHGRLGIQIGPTLRLP